MKRDDIIFLSIAIIVAGVILANITSEDTIFGVITEPLRDADWDKIKPRNIVKHTIPITVLERDGECLVSAEKLYMAFDHIEFIRSEQLERGLDYDREENTIKIGCDEVPQDTMNLHIWYVIQEAPDYQEKFTYFITDPSITVENATIPK